MKLTAIENIYYKNQSAAGEIIEQNAQNSTTAAYYYHLVTFVNVNTSKQVKTFFVYVCKLFSFFF